MNRVLKSAYLILSLVLMVFAVNNCDNLVLIDEDNLNNPNELTEGDISPDLLLNNIQLEARNVFITVAERTAEVTRMEHMFGPLHGNAPNFQATSFTALYTNAYADLMVDVKNLLSVTEDPSQANLSFHSGMAKTLKAYVLITMVDVFGDVPYSQAIDASNFNPELDKGADVYAAALSLLDEAIKDLGDNNRSRFPDNDFYYGTADKEQPELWIRAANTIKLKAYLNMGETEKIRALVKAGNLILEPAHDFKFSYSTTQANPDSRHPWFINNYDADGGADYMSVGYMNLLLNDKEDLVDPRIRYYFYRQVNQDTRDFNENNCINAATPPHYPLGMPFCLLGKGYWGRNHLNADGIPPDGLLRTVYGVYPVGGEFDKDQPTINDKRDAPVDFSLGRQGAGIAPILMSSFTHFMIAEAELNAGNPGVAKTALETAIKLSMETVRDFGAGLTTISNASGELIDFRMLDADIENYIRKVTDKWDTNTSDNARLHNIAKEYYLALWTNGLEAYNLMRRTGYPESEDLQPAENDAPGTWYRSFRYPAAMVDRNSNVSQKDASGYGTGPFWDKGNGNFDF